LAGPRRASSREGCPPKLLAQRAFSGGGPPPVAEIVPDTPPSFAKTLTPRAATDGKPASSRAPCEGCPQKPAREASALGEEDAHRSSVEPKVDCPYSSLNDSRNSRARISGVGSIGDSFSRRA
jgi:hypothetical protein